MKPRITNLEALCKTLKPFLPQFLEEHGINTAGNFSCIDPKHEDKNASMTCKKVPEAAFCFSCLKTFDIFAAASILEGKPEKGKDWVAENVFYLANKYNVPIPNVELTDEEIYEYKTYDAYKLAAELVSDLQFGDYTLVDKEIERREWDKQKIASWGIGTVNYHEFRERLKKAGFDAKFLDGVDLGRSNLFDNNNLIFTVYDDEGRPVGFSAKKLGITDGDKSPRYINTADTGLECAIFKKGERLYGFDVAKDTIINQLYVFEGQSNVITLRHHGLMNCCSMMGKNLTDHHIALLKKYGKFDLVLMFDGDQAGKDGLKKALDSKFSQERDFQVKICQLPLNKDPDELVRESGFPAFNQLKKWTAFEWRIEQLLGEIDGEPDEEQRENIVEKTIPIILSEPSYIRQEKMAKQIAKMSGISLSSILNDIRRLRDTKVNEVLTKKKNIIEALLYEVRSNPEDAEIQLAQCQRAISDIDKTNDTKNESSSTLNFITSMKELDEAKTGEFEGFRLRPETFGDFQYRFNGDWKSNTLIYVGGSSQASKTSFVSQLGYEIALDPRNNAMCIYHSIDDPKTTILKKWICSGVDGYDLYQNHVASPKYWEKEIEGTIKKREQGYKNLINLVNDHRLVIKDVSDGNSFAYIEGIVRYYRDIYPERNIVLFEDNFHKLPDLEHLSGHERTKQLSNHLKRSAVKNKTTIIATAEYRKLGIAEKPSNNALAECLEENTLIRDLSTGNQIKIKDVCPGMKVLTIDDKTLNLSEQKVLNKVYKGTQNCFRLSLSNGMFVEGTENHPLYQDCKGWSKIKDLKVGDYVATPKNIPLNLDTNYQYLTPSLGRFLGYMAGDGNYGTKSKISATPRFTNKDLEVIKDISNIVVSNFKDIKVVTNEHLGSQEIKFSKTKGTINNLTQWLKNDIKIWDELGDKKTIPDCIFKSSREIKSNYIAGLFITDGSFDKIKRQLRFFNSSPYLIYGLQTLLLDLNINSTISKGKEKKKECHKEIYSLRISACSVNEFKKNINLIGYKKAILETIEPPEIYTLREDNLPLAFSYQLNKFLVDSKITVWRKTEGKSDYPIYKTKRIGRKIYNQIREALPILPEDTLKLASENIIWQKISSIDPIGEKEVYDLEISGTHNFLANNIFCHNSRALDYDADGIIHLYNDMHINGENSPCIHLDSSGKILPRIWCNIGKNKISGETCTEYFDLYPGSAKLVMVDKQRAIEEYFEREEYLKQKVKKVKFNEGV